MSANPLDPLARVQVHPAFRHVDARGWLLKVLMRNQTGAAPFGEIYVTLAWPGQQRAGHYHDRTREWFCPAAGRGVLVLADRTGSVRQRVALDGEQPVTVEVPPQVAHLIVATGAEPLMVVAYADRPYDPAEPDTVAVAMSS